MDTFTVTISGTREDPSGSESIDDSAFEDGVGFLVQALVDSGWPRDQIVWSASTNDSASGSGTGDDYDPVTLP